MEDMEYQTISSESEQKRSQLKIKKYVSIVACVTVGLLVGLLIGYLSFKGKKEESPEQQPVLARKYSLQPNAASVSRANAAYAAEECTILESFTCPDTMYNASDNMPEKWANHLWNTPKRGEPDWKEGY